MKHFIAQSDADRLAAIAARGKVLTDELTKLENEAKSIVGIDDGLEFTEADDVVDFVWNGSPVADLLRELVLEVR